MKNENKITFAILKEKISPDNVLAMAELIAVSETKFLIGYMGERMYKLHKDLYIDIKHNYNVFIFIHKHKAEGKIPRLVVVL